MFLTIAGTAQRRHNLSGRAINPHGRLNFLFSTVSSRHFLRSSLILLPNRCRLALTSTTSSSATARNSSFPLRRLTFVAYSALEHYRPHRSSQGIDTQEFEGNHQGSRSRRRLTCGPGAVPDRELLHSRRLKKLPRIYRTVSLIHQTSQVGAAAFGPPRPLPLPLPLPCLQPKS